jgi:hypothetical protein
MNTWTKSRTRGWLLANLPKCADEAMSMRELFQRAVNSGQAFGLRGLRNAMGRFRNLGDVGVVLKTKQEGTFGTYPVECYYLKNPAAGERRGA